uniref:RNA helicase n=1 Tax=Anopheles minimus TaxID=112268 RepID=A0A182WFB6_9DIPT
MENQIFITYFSSPHKFWYKPFHPGSQKKELKLLQSSIDEYCEQHYMNQEIVGYEPIFGEIVVYFDPLLARWTRCSVEGIMEEDKRMRTYRLWLIDEGYPKVVDMVHLKPLPEKFHNKSSSIVKQGAIKNIIPAHYVYDTLVEELRKAACPSWNEQASNLMHSVIEGTQKVCFTNLSSYPFGKESISFGDLLFYANSKTFNAVDILSQCAAGLIVDSETFLNYVLEKKATFTSQAPLLVSESLNDSGSFCMAINSQEQSIASNEVYERQFDESASMIEMTTPNQAVIGDSQPSSVQQMVKKMKNASLKDGKGQTPAKPAVHTTSLTALCKTTSMHLTEEMHANDPLAQIRTSPQALTIDVAQATQAEYELMHTKQIKSPIPANPPACDLVPKTPDAPTSPKLVNNESSEKGGTASKLMRKIIKIKANVNQQKSIIPVPDQSDPHAMGIGPAGVPISSLLTSEKLPTSESNAALKRFEKSHYRVLVHGSKLPNPIDRIEAVNFSPRVHQHLEELDITKIHRLQAYAWPHILRGNSFICVNGANTGKTFSFLPAVCSVVQRQIEESLIPSAAGPVAIIVCYSSREVQRIAFFCRKMLNSAAHPELTVLECYGIRNVTKNCNLLFNGCAILITTAPGYRRLYERAPEAFVRKRIQTVVIDNIEEIWPQFAAELRLLCKNCEKQDLQMIITAEYWIPVLSIFLQRYHNMIISIGAFIEAAVYAKADFSFRLFAINEQKDVELIRQLRQHDYRNERTIVFGKDSADLLPIVSALQQTSINHIVCNERTVLQQHAGFSNWDEQLPGDMVVFVCSDEVLGDLKITKAQHIIHYSLPSTWSTFTRRYACSFEYYECPYLSCESKREKGKPSSLVLLNENNNQELPRLVDFLELHMPKVSEKLLTYAKRIRSIHESTKIAEGRAVSMLCTHVLGLGVCRNIRNCVYRHALTPDDLATAILPTSGKIKLKICHIFSPTHYAVHLTAHQSASAYDWTVLNDGRRYMVQDIALQAHYSNEDRHQMHGVPRRNELCAVYHEQNYSRCRIINHDETNLDNGEVQLQLIDTGRIIHVKSSVLLFLPEQFRELPGQAFNVRIAALVPHDYEQDWDKTATIAVRQWIEEHENRSNCFIEGNVLLTLKDTLWIDDLYLVEQLKGVNATVTTKRIGATVISKQYGIGDKKTFEQIRQIVQDCEKLAMQLLRHEVQENEKQNKQDRLNILDEPEDTEELEMGVVERTDHFNNPTPDQRLEMIQANENIEHIHINSVQCDSDEMENGVKLAEADHNKLVPVALDETSCSSYSSFEELSLCRDKDQYQFDTLLVSRTYNVAIGHYLAPDNFYVYRLDRISEVDAAIKEFVKDGSNLTPLKNPHINQHCLVFYENFYHRARLTKVVKVDAGIEAEVFLLDFGGIFKCNHIFKISENLLRSVPFLAIKGSLAHIYPPNGATEWTDEVAAAIYDKWLEKHNQGSMFASVTKVLPLGSTTPIVGCHRYEVVLSDGNSPDEFSILLDIVYDKLALLQQEDIEDEATSTVTVADDDFTQVNFTQEELMTMMKEIIAPRNENSQSKLSSSETQDIEGSHHIAEDAVSRVSEHSSNYSRAQCTTLLPKSNKQKEPSRILRSNRKLHLKPLVSDYRFAQTVWQQNKYFIVLRIHAPDVKRYDLVVSNNSLLLQFVNTDDAQRYVVPLNLFSTIDARHTVHEIRGLSIVVRLRKLVPSIRWPKLYKHGRRLAWVKAATTNTVNDSGSSSDEMVKQNRWKGLVQAQLDSPVDSSQSGNEKEIDSDAEDEERVFLAMN